MAPGKLVNITIVLAVVVVIVSLSLSAFLAPRTDMVIVRVNTDSSWSGEVTVRGDGRVYVHALPISGNDSAWYIFERPDGVNNWQIAVTVGKNTSEYTELEVVIYDGINSKQFIRKSTSKPNGTLEVFWMG